MMTASKRDHQLMREAEGYLDLSFATLAELPLPMRLQLSDRCLCALAQLSDEIRNRAPAKMLFGHALKLGERFDEAAAAFAEVAATDDENIHVYLALGWCHKRRGRLDLAIEALERGVEVDPTVALLHYNLACYWALSEKLDLTIVYLGRALDIDPNLRDLIINESDFDAVRDNASFHALTAVNV